MSEPSKCRTRMFGGHVWTYPGPEHTRWPYDGQPCNCGEQWWSRAKRGGYPTEPPWDESQEGVQADRPEDLPVPANADKRFDCLDGG